MSNNGEVKKHNNNPTGLVVVKCLIGVGLASAVMYGIYKFGKSKTTRQPSPPLEQERSSLVPTSVQDAQTSGFEPSSHYTQNRDWLNHPAYGGYFRIVDGDTGQILSDDPGKGFIVHSRIGYGDMIVYKGKGLVFDQYPLGVGTKNKLGSGTWKVSSRFLPHVGWDGKDHVATFSVGGEKIIINHDIESMYYNNNSGGYTPKSFHPSLTPTSQQAFGNGGDDGGSASMQIAYLDEHKQRRIAILVPTPTKYDWINSNQQQGTTYPSIILFRTFQPYQDHDNVNIDTDKLYALDWNGDNVVYRMNKDRSIEKFLSSKNGSEWTLTSNNSNNNSALNSLLVVDPLASMDLLDMNGKRIRVQIRKDLKFSIQLFLNDLVVSEPNGSIHTQQTLTFLGPDERPYQAVIVEMNATSQDSKYQID